MNLLRKGIIISAIAMAVGAQAQTWDLEGDYLPNMNPNGAWQYGQVNGGVFSDLAWDAAGSYGVPGVGAFVYQNNSGMYLYGVPAGDVTLESDWGNAAVQWTAPTAGTYNFSIAIGGSTQWVNGGFGNNFAYNAGVTSNGSGVTANSFTNNVMDWDFTETLGAGQSVTAFVINPGYADGGNNDTHFTVQSVPEPAPFAALGLGALAFLRRRRA